VCNKKGYGEFGVELVVLPGNLHKKAPQYQEKGRILGLKG
jgi:hypothetical protein